MQGQKVKQHAEKWVRKVDRQTGRKVRCEVG